MLKILEGTKKQTYIQVFIYFLCETQFHKQLRVDLLPKKMGTACHNIYIPWTRYHQLGIGDVLRIACLLIRLTNKMLEN